MHTPAADMGQTLTLVPGLRGRGDGKAAARWIEQAFSVLFETSAVGAALLVGLDRDGEAFPLAGALPREHVTPRLLEAIESPDLWRAVATTRSYSSEQLAQLSSCWPSEATMGAFFIKDKSAALGVLLAQGRSAVGGDREAVLLAQLLTHWRQSRAARSLEAFTRALIGAQPGGVLAIDAQGRVTHLSSQAEEILGMTMAEARGADCGRVLTPAGHEEHPLLRGLAGKLAQVELYMTDRQGRDLPVALCMDRICDEQGDVQGLVCIVRDLTEERALDQEARRRERLAVIGELAAGAAHEIRNPLTGIGNCAQVLQMRLAEQESNRRMADLILQEAQRLERIITSLLGFARPGQPCMRESRIEDIVRQALELDRPVFEQAGVRCDVRTIGIVPAIYIDPEQIQQVVANLLRNGVAAMPDGGRLTVDVSVVRRRLHIRQKLGRRATDRITVASKGPQVRFVRIKVQDTGKGIPPDTLGRIFDPFFTTRSKGTGLGLSVSQSIIQEHGGWISVQSVQGKGAIFEVDLPVERRHGERRDGQGDG